MVHLGVGVFLTLVAGVSLGMLFGQQLSSFVLGLPAWGLLLVTIFAGITGWEYLRSVTWHRYR